MQQQRVELVGRDSLQRFASCTLMIAKNVQKIISLYFTFILFQRVQTSETNATRSIYFTLNLFHAKCAGSLNKTTISHSHVTLTFFDGEFLGEVEDVSSFLFGD